MEILLPDVKAILLKISEVSSSFNGFSTPIENHIKIHRQRIKDNKKLLQNGNSKNNIKIFKIFIADLLMRSLKGERGVKLSNSIDRNINSFNDFTEYYVTKALNEAGYRFLEAGVQVDKMQ